MQIKRVAHKKKHDRTAPTLILIWRTLLSLSLNNHSYKHNYIPQHRPNSNPLPLTIPSHLKLYLTLHLNHHHRNMHKSTPFHYTVEDVSTYGASRLERFYDNLLFSSSPNYENFKRVFSKRSYSKSILVDFDSFKKKGYNFELLISN